MASTPRIPNAEITGLYGALSDSAESCSMTSPSRRAKASEVSRWRESTVFTSLERDVMEYAEAMSETPPRVIEELFSRLLQQSVRPPWWSSRPGLPLQT